MRRRGRAGGGLLVGLLLGVLWLAHPAAGAQRDPVGDEPRRIQDRGAGGGTELTVMARNLYLGADVGVALELLPDMPAAAQFMWEQLAATDFSARAPLLAAEAARHRPAVIGLQEATTWRCRPGNVGRTVDVHDFTARFLEATRAAGVPYVVAEHDGRRAYNEGYSIPALPFLSVVDDPATFQPLFDRDSATCGFAIADALLVREDLVDGIVAAGTSEYRDRYVVAPTLLTIDRGYAWADIRIADSTVRFVTTHLESLWDADEPTLGGMQARQLVEDLEDTTLPLVVMGDLNNDPRDPRPSGAPNPAGQPEAGDGCAPQVEDPTAATAEPRCNAYWTLRQAGFADAGPDPFDGGALTWGTNALLAGPDPARLEDALRAGNAGGFTDRLDYVLLHNGAEAVGAEVIGDQWPDGPDLWDCDHPEQVALTEQAAGLLAEAGLTEPIEGRGVCLPTDHAGVVAQVRVPANAADASSPAPPEHARFPIGFWGWVGLLLLALIVWWVARRWRRRRSSGVATREAAA
jgi:hypothetical protein